MTVLPTHVTAIVTRAAKSRFLRNVSAMTAGNVFSTALVAVQGVLVARWLGPESYGLAALITAYPALLFSLLDARSWEATVKFISDFRSRGDQAKTVSVILFMVMVDALIAVGVLFVTVASASVVVRLTMDSAPEARSLLLVYAASFLAQSARPTAYAVLSVMNRFSTISILDIATNLIRSLTILLAVGLGGGVAGFVWGSAAGSVVQGLLFAVAGWRLIGREWNLTWHRGAWSGLGGERRNVIRFLLYNDLLSLLSAVKQLDVLLLGYFRDVSEVGYFRLARTISMSAGHLITPLQTVSYPRLIAAWARSRVDFVRLIERLMVTVGLPAAVALAVAAPVLTPGMVALLFGPTYAEAVAPTVVLLWASAFSLVCFWVRPVYLAVGLFRPWLVANALWSVFLSGAYVVTAARWGALGVAWAFCVTLGIYYALLCAALVSRLRSRPGV